MPFVAGLISLVEGIIGFMGGGVGAVAGTGTGLGAEIGDGVDSVAALVSGGALSSAWRGQSRKAREIKY